MSRNRKVDIYTCESGSGCYRYVCSTERFSTQRAAKNDYWAKRNGADGRPTIPIDNIQTSWGKTPKGKGRL